MSSASELDESWVSGPVLSNRNEIILASLSNNSGLCLYFGSVFEFRWHLHFACIGLYTGGNSHDFDCTRAN